MRFLFIAVIIGISFWSCDTFDPTVRIPSYVYIDTFTINNGLSSWEEDSIYSYKISDVWIYFDESKLQGAYELPALVPIEQTGYTRLTLRAGIKKGGSSTNRSLYPYYYKYNINLDLKPDHVDTIRPVTYYDGGTSISPLNLIWQEDFDDNIGGSEFTYAKYSDTTVVTIDNDEIAFRGNQCGGIFLNEDQYSFEMISPNIDLPGPNVPVYLELNYKTNHKFFVGLYFDDKNIIRQIYTVRAKEEWNKIYFDFTQYIQENGSSKNFNVYIGFNREPQIPTVEMYIDNIKLLHY